MNTLLKGKQDRIGLCSPSMRLLWYSCNKERLTVSGRRNMRRSALRWNWWGSCWGTADSCSTVGWTRGRPQTCCCCSVPKARHRGEFASSHHLGHPPICIQTIYCFTAKLELLHKSHDHIQRRYIRFVRRQMSCCSFWRWHRRQSRFWSHWVD